MTLLRLFEYAAGPGVCRVRGLIFASNDRMLDFARKLQLKIRGLPDDSTVLEGSGSPARVNSVTFCASLTMFLSQAAVATVMPRSRRQAIA
ncbi:MAG TPA: hypothetical protein VNX02_09015 [Steroidobacteraceae bacterium]|jgi:hypothetical protein|nr:hypothetical protein [Steroidobacteraceae bacterium]